MVRESITQAATVVVVLSIGDLRYLLFIPASESSLGLLLVNPYAISALSPVVPSAHAVLARFVEKEGRELETRARRGGGAQPAATWLRSATRAANHIAAAANAMLIATDKAAPGSAPSVCGSAR